MSEIRQAQQAITEGFICVNCKRQFGGVDELLTHFEQCQKKGAFTGQGTGGDLDSAGGGGFKGFFDKAKQKLRFEPTQSPQNVTSSISSQSGVYGASGGGGSGFQDKSSPTPTYFNDFDNAVEVKGVSRSSFDDFKKIRAGRLERYAAESNKLKIRLFKLVSGLEKFPALMTKTSAGLQDYSEWKVHEKSVVNWLEEKPVTRCPECAQGFNLLKRKHHCRLCGSILCHDCSDFIPLAEALEILHSERKIRDDVACASITFRTCVHCARILRQESQSPFNSKNFSDSVEARLLDIYGTIRNKMTEIDKLLPQLVTVVESIQSGETLYSKEEANLLRSKLLRATEQIDLLSKQISAIKSESGSLLMLQQRIRQSCVAYIRDFIRQVPIVPDTSDDALSTSSSIGGVSGIVMTGDGWSISAPENRDDGHGSSDRHFSHFEDNPIQQQINNVKFYIEQAKAAGKMDEVDILASNLREMILWQKEQENK